MDLSNYSPALVLMVVVGLALAPFVAVMVTSFTKIVVVLSLLRNALGLQQVPPNVVINGLAIVLSIYVMYPVILDTSAAVNARMAGEPPPATVQAQMDEHAARQAEWFRRQAAAAAMAAQAGPGEDTPVATSPAAADALRAEAQALAEPERGELFGGVTGGTGAAPASGDEPGTEAASTPLSTPILAATGPAPAPGPPTGTDMDAAYLLSLFDAGKEPLRAFMIRHSHAAERQFFLDSAHRLMPDEHRATLSPEHFIVVIPAFTVSELTTAFQIGFLIFLPFLIIDLVVANLLLALGMMMMSPTIVSLPFKLLLFVLVDGWAKLVHGLVLTYAVV